MQLCPILSISNSEKEHDFNNYGVNLWLMPLPKIKNTVLLSDVVDKVQIWMSLQHAQSMQCFPPMKPQELTINPSRIPAISK